MKYEATFSEIRLREKGEFNPLIVEFLNGDVPDEKSSTVKAKLFPHENLREKAIEISTPDGQKYVNGPINNFLMNSRFIAIRNRKTNKVRLVEVEFTHVINKILCAKEGMKENATSNKEQLATLQRMFGTRKAVRHLEQKEALEIDKSHVENQINQILDNLPAQELSIVSQSINKTKMEVEEGYLLNLIPPCYRDATNISDVYKVEDCISENEIASLETGVKEILNEGPTSANLSQFLKSNLPAALSTSENLQVRLSCLLYADALVKYLKTNAKFLSKAASTLSPYSTIIGEKIISEFCLRTGSSINRPLSMKDKAVCYVIVLTLIACNHKIDLEALSKITSYGYKKLKQLGRIVGVVQAGKMTSIHTLTLPLPPPVSMIKKSKPASWK